MEVTVMDIRVKQLLGACDRLYTALERVTAEAGAAIKDAPVESSPELIALSRIKVTADEAIYTHDEDAGRAEEWGVWD